MHAFCTHVNKVAIMHACARAWPQQMQLKDLLNVCTALVK